MFVSWPSKLPLDMIIQIAKKYSVEPTLVMAICQQESAGRIYAQRFEPVYPWLFKPEECARALGCSLVTEQIGQQNSYGLMQIMGAVLRERGFKGWFGEAFTPSVNLEFGVKHLAQYMSIHKNERLAIASYNAGSPRKSADDPSKLVNEDYVQSVLRWKAQVDGKTK